MILSNRGRLIFSFKNYRFFKKSFLRFLCLTFLGINPLFSYPNFSPEKARHDTIEVLDSLMKLNGLMDNKLIIHYASIARKLSSGNNDPQTIALTCLLLGIAVSPAHPDSGFYYFIKAVHIADSIHADRIKGRALFEIASLYADVDDYKTALLLYDSALRIAERNNFFESEVIFLTAIGNVHIKCEDSLTSLKYYQQALKLATQHGFHRDEGIVTGNLAAFGKTNTERINKTKQAISILGKIKGAEFETVQFMANLGNYMTEPGEAMKIYQKALEIAGSANLGITKIALLNNLAYSYLDLGQPALAANALVNVAIPEAKALNNSDWLSTLYDSYADVLKARNDYKGAATYLRLAINERARADQQKAASQVRLLGAMLDSKNKEITIQKNTLAIDEQYNLIRRQYTALNLAGLIIFTFILIIVIVLQKTRLRLKTQQINLSKQILELEESEKTEVSRELHDTISNLMQQLTGYVRSLGTIPGGLQDEINSKLDEISASIRRISHRIQGVDYNKSKLTELISELCYDIKNITGLNTNFRFEEDFPALEFEQSRVLYRITQEWLNNASKYARDAIILITLKTAEGSVLLSYTDDGAGFDPAALLKSGIGIRNIRERATLLGGNARLTSSPGNGMDWLVTIPLKKTVNKRRNI